MLINISIVGTTMESLLENMGNLGIRNEEDLLEQFYLEWESMIPMVTK